MSNNFRFNEASHRVECVQHAAATAWCEHLASIEDGPEGILRAGMRLSVPIFPDVNVDADVHIGPVKWGDMAPVEMNFVPDIGRPYSVDLGVFAPGDGVGTLRECIIEHMAARIDPRDMRPIAEIMKKDGALFTKCPVGSHGVREVSESILQWKTQNGILRWLWDVVFEKACTPCINALGGGSDPDNFGINPEDMGAALPRGGGGRNTPSGTPNKPAPKPWTPPAPSDPGGLGDLPF